jgi:hypothetical protein
MKLHHARIVQKAAMAASGECKALTGHELVAVEACAGGGGLGGTLARRAAAFAAIWEAPR